MPRGQPDYGLYTATPVASGISDPGEAAARLGGINIYDRRGWTVWQDDFEAAVLKWLTATVAAGSNPVLSTEQSWMGIQSVKLQVTAAVADRSAMFNFFPLVRLGKIGAEFFIYLKGTTPAYLSLQLTIYDGTNVSWAELRLDNNARTATIVTPAGNIIVATFVFPLIAYETFIPVKLVIDIDTDFYTRLLVGPQEIDLSAHALNPIGATTQRLITGNLTLVGGALGAAICHIDNFILTQNEP